MSKTAGPFADASWNVLEMARITSPRCPELFVNHADALAT